MNLFDDACIVSVVPITLSSDEQFLGGEGDERARSAKEFQKTTNFRSVDGLKDEP